MITGVLLAAGRGERFGGDKLHATLPDGRAVAVAAAEAMIGALPRVVAVTRPDDSATAALLGAAGCEIVVCERAAEGMGASLACGVAACRTASGWVIGLADMPAIRAEIIRAVAAALVDGAHVAAPVHDGLRGHPVGFAAEFGPALVQLAGDEGARRIVSAHHDQLTLLEVTDPGIRFDIDVPCDLPATDA